MILHKMVGALSTDLLGAIWTGQVGAVSPEFPYRYCNSDLCIACIWEYRQCNTTTGLTIEQNGTGDAVVQYLFIGGQRWVTGIDNNDGDKFKISSTADVGSNPRVTILTTGEVS